MSKLVKVDSSFGGVLDFLCKCSFAFFFICLRPFVFVCVRFCSRPVFTNCS
ncbi:hypothetical protein HanIR_Chr07g0334261 [Helianthus annuus]|nr:hypothetical protein HanIR_Chr07g0334261 [Helianthus annuus]